MLFIAGFFILTGLTHFALYRFALRCLAIAHPLAKALFLAAFSFLALSFMASFFLLRWNENPWTIGFYRFSGVWFALAVNLILALGATWLLYGGLRLAGFSNASFRGLAVGCLVLAMVWSVHGFWSAFHPVLKPVEVQLDNLPENWRGKTIVQLSDVHLGHFHTARSFERLVDRVNGLAPDLIVITGDLFDGMSRVTAGLSKPLARLQARHGVFFVTGNHEVYSGLRRCMDTVARSGIRILNNEVVEVEGLNFMGVAYPGIRDKNEIQGLDTLLASASQPRPCILLFHTPTDVLLDEKEDYRSATYFRPNTSFSLNKELGVSLQLSGHSHKGQIFPFGLLTSWLYSGYDYGLRREGSFTLYTTSGVGTWGPPMRTGNTPEIVVITLK
jgi:uncharacterized protein